MIVRALTIRQPWAWLILHGTKRVENRSWHLPPSMVGEAVYIHAGAGMTYDEWRGARDFVARAGLGGLASRMPPPGLQLVRGAIVGAMTLDGCRCDRPSDDPWHVPGLHGWMLRDVRLLKQPVPCKGALGFWKPSADILEAAKSALET